MLELVVPEPEPASQMNGVILGCYNCKELMVYGTERCKDCGMEYPLEFWRQYGQYIRDESEFQDEKSKENDYRPLDFTFETRLCCNQDPEQCTCTHPINWLDTFDIPSDINFNVYNSPSMCEDCDHFWTARCIPYRNFAYNYLLTGDVGDEINGCEHFLDSYSY